MLRCYAVTLSRSLLTHFLLYKASHHEEFLGSLAAEILKGIILRVVRLAEVRAELAIGPTVASQDGCQVDAERGVEVMGNKIGSKALRAGSRIGSKALRAGSK